MYCRAEDNLDGRAGELNVVNAAYSMTRVPIRCTRNALLQLTQLVAAPPFSV